MSGTIFVTGARAPVAVDLARAFFATGFQVHFVDSAPAWGARMSRAGAATHRVPSPRHAFAHFADALLALVREHDPLAVIPTCEEVFYVAAAAARDGYAERVAAPPLETLRKLHSKFLFPRWLSELGLASAGGWRLVSREDVARLPLPPGRLVFKPEFSRFARATLIRPLPSEIERIAPTPAAPWVAQPFLEGEEICFWSFLRAGGIVAHAAYRPFWRAARSASFAFDPLDCPRLLAIAERIGAATGMTGHLAFDAIVDPEGQVTPIECNPRATSGVHLFDAAPALALAMLGYDATPRVVGAPRYLGLAMAILGPFVATRERRWTALVRDATRGRDALGRAGDRRPILGALLDAARFAALGWGRGAGAAAGATTDDIEWNGEAIA